MPSTKCPELAGNLIVFAGMPRTASTSLFHILGQHPDVFRPFRKEMGYFLFNHAKGERWYCRAYAGANGKRCIDVTPEYFFSRLALERMLAFGDGVRVVIGVREPVSFARSLYGEYGKRFAMPPFEQFVDGYSYRRRRESISFSLRDGVIRSMIDHYRRAFGQRVLFYDYRKFVEDPLFVLQRVERFGSLRPFFTETTFDNIRMNTGDRKTVRWLSALISAEPLIDAASWMLPPPVLRLLAGTLYGKKKAPVAAPLPAREDEPRPAWLVELLHEDSAAVRELFRDGPVVDGVGAVIQPA